MSEEIPSPLLCIASARLPAVLIRADLGRYMRVKKQIQGLIDLYRHTDVREGVGVEIGCYWGESSEIAAHFLRRLYCIDPWKSEKDEREFDQRMSRFDNVTKRKQWSHEAANAFQPDVIDILYIDAKHDRENVKRDILCWFPKVKTGGWIAGHDYDNNPSHVGVVQAVDEILGKPMLRFQDMSFLFRKTPELAARVSQHESA